MKTQRAFGQIVVLALPAALGVAAGAATLFSASAEGHCTQEILGVMAEVEA